MSNQKIQNFIGSKFAQKYLKMRAVQNMDMQMFDFLTAVPTGPDQGLKPRVLQFQNFRDLTYASDNFGHKLLVNWLKIHQAGNVLFGNQQNMHRRHGVNVFKRHQGFTLPNNFAGNFFLGDFAKNTNHKKIYFTSGFKMILSPFVFFIRF